MSSFTKSSYPASFPVVSSFMSFSAVVGGWHFQSYSGEGRPAGSSKKRKRAA